MATDYQARKSAKSTRRRLSEQPKRERKKKNQPRRLCRGPCFSPPSLDVENSDEDAPMPSRTSAGGELSKYINLTFDANANASRKRKQPAKSETDRSGKKPKLSTQVQLIVPNPDSNKPTSLSKKAAKASSASTDGDLASFPEQIQSFFHGEGLNAPLPVQTLCWPHLLAGHDVQAVAEPGSGKTIAYLLPAAVALADQGHTSATTPDAPLALILLPTRELAQQVAGVCQGVRKHCGGLRTACLTGGTDKERQATDLGKKPHILVATPGRLLDMIDDGHVSLGSVQYVVLDEADKMLEKGFASQIERIKAMLGVLSFEEEPIPAASKTSKKPSKKGSKVSGGRIRPQAGLFTATMPPAVRAVADAWLRFPKRVALASSASGAATGRAISSTVLQVVQVCAEHKKPAKLLKHLAGIKAAAAAANVRHAPRVLIFSNRIKTVRFVHKQVLNAGFRAAQLHGERSQEERETAVKDFKSGKVQILVASDVAARGLDIQNLPYVVNYDFPGNLETYVHRVGRTGRLAADGHAFSFLTRELAPLAKPLLRLLRDHDQSVDPNLVKLAEAYEVAAKKLGLPIGRSARASTSALAARKGGGGGSGGGGSGGDEEGSEEKEEEEEGNGGDSEVEELDEEDDACMGRGGKKGQLRPATEAVLRELDMKSKAQKKKDRVMEKREEMRRKKKEEAAAMEEDARESDEDSEEEERQQGGRKKQDPRKKKEALPEFVASKKFGGARPGYVFKKGGMGMGYYMDRPPHAILKELSKARNALLSKSKAVPIGGKKESQKNRGW